VAVVCEDYPHGQISKEDFASDQRAIGQLVDELPEEGFTPRVGNSYWAKGAAIMVCDDGATREWLATKVPTMAACAGSPLKLVGLEDLLTYRRVVAWFPGPREDTERYFLRLRRLNQGLETGLWRVYERKEEPNAVRLVLSVDSSSTAVLEGLGCRPYGGVGHAVFSFLGVKPEGRK
jgi:hypothetical protein